jgi:hypothetical protein
MQYTLNTNHVAFIREIAEELDKADNADILWLKYQGPSLRRIAEAIAAMVAQTSTECAK